MSDEVKKAEKKDGLIGFGVAMGLLIGLVVGVLSFGWGCSVGVWSAQGRIADVNGTVLVEGYPNRGEMVVRDKDGKLTAVKVVLEKIE